MMHVSSTERQSGPSLDDITQLWLSARWYYRVPAVRSKLTDVKVKVKGTLLQALRLCTGRTAHRD